MKKQLLLSVYQGKRTSDKSSWAMFALAVVFTLAFAACGGGDDDDDEPNNNPQLLDKTTPVTFQLNNGVSYMFDYAGNQFIGSDTIEVYNGKYYADGTSFPNDIEIDLRQGQHHVIWFERLSRTSSGVHFNPQTKALTVGSQDEAGNILYAECDLNVSEYLLPKQKLEFMPATSRIFIMLSDKPSAGAAINDNGYVVGKIRGIPHVTSAELHGSNFNKSDAAGAEIKINPSAQFFTGAFLSEHILCPKDGIDNIQLTIEVKDKNGQSLTTTKLPTFSIRRGQVTELFGPLFSGSIADWQVASESYEQFDKEVSVK